MYSLEDGKPLSDVVLGLKVKSTTLSDPISVILTIAQNRFLLNSLNEEGFLNMRLTDKEAEEVKGVDEHGNLVECIQSQPCLMEKGQNNDFRCTHGSLFGPKHSHDSKLMQEFTKV